MKCLKDALEFSHRKKDILVSSAVVATDLEEFRSHLFSAEELFGHTCSWCGVWQPFEKPIDAEKLDMAEMSTGDGTIETEAVHIMVAGAPESTLISESASSRRQFTGVSSSSHFALDKLLHDYFLACALEQPICTDLCSEEVSIDGGVWRVLSDRKVAVLSAPGVSADVKSYLSPGFLFCIADDVQHTGGRFVRLQDACGTSGGWVSVWSRKDSSKQVLERLAIHPAGKDVEFRALQKVPRARIVEMVQQMGIAVVDGYSISQLSSLLLWSLCLHRKSLGGGEQGAASSLSHAF